MLRRYVFIVCAVVS